MSFWERVRHCGPILIIDPDPDARALISAALECVGLLTLEASTGEEGLAAAHRELPSVVVLDVTLPRLSGYELCRELRESFGERLGIIFVSAERTSPLDRLAGLSLGSDDYFAKPVNEGELITRVRRLIAAHPAALGEPDSP